MNIKELKDKVLNGKAINKEEALFLYDQDLESLTKAANEIREFLMGNGFELCTIINAKSGSCSENCKFCAQSAHYSNQVKQFPLLDKETILGDAKKQKEAGLQFYSLVTVGRRLSSSEVGDVADIIKTIKENVDIHVCASLGLLEQRDFEKLREAGLRRVHNNLESSSNFFPQICSSHSFQDKLEAIKAAQAADLEVCSGGLIGLGETREDRVDLALSLRDLGIKSSPINVLHPIPGTPFEDKEALSMEEIVGTFAVFRFLLPHSHIRLAGGRALMAQGGKACLKAGANAAITGDLLSTAGINVESDKKMLEEAGFQVYK